MAASPIAQLHLSSRWRQEFTTVVGVRNGGRSSQRRQVILARSSLCSLATTFVESQLRHVFNVKF
ncbi:hypothetical protein Ancab_021054, partial [Ancistrocladus abbreviatus]